jgi:hypothetical protein
MQTPVRKRMPGGVGFRNPSWTESVFGKRPGVSMNPRIPWMTTSDMKAAKA